MEAASLRTMADPPATHHILNSISAVTATFTVDMSECTYAQAGGTPDTTDTTPTSSTEPSAAASMVSPSERAVPTSPTMPNHVDIATFEPKPWPRLHLLGLPRELRDQIYTYAIVSDKPVDIGSGGRRQKYFYDIPALTKVSRQLRLETRGMFLEQNTLTFDEETLITSLSSKPFNALKALCAGSELKNIRIYSHRYGGCSGNDIDATLVATKTSDGLDVSLTIVESRWKACSCRVERLANEYGDQDGAIIRFLEALRLDYTGDIHYACDNEVFDEERDEEFFDLIIGQDTTICDIHLDSVLY